MVSVGKMLLHPLCRNVLQKRIVKTYARNWKLKKCSIADNHYQKKPIVNTSRSHYCNEAIFSLYLICPLQSLLFLLLSYWPSIWHVLLRELPFIWNYFPAKFIVKKEENKSLLSHSAEHSTCITVHRLKSRKFWYNTLVSTQ